MRIITKDSTREEVLAALAEHDEWIASLRHYSDDEIDWRGDPPEKRTGCYSSKDGKVIVCMGDPSDEDPVLAAQQRAGEEDQADGAPEWGC